MDRAASLRTFTSLADSPPDQYLLPAFRFGFLFTFVPALLARRLLNLKSGVLRIALCTLVAITVSGATVGRTMGQGDEWSLATVFWGVTLALAMLMLLFVLRQSQSLVNGWSQHFGRARQTVHGDAGPAGFHPCVEGAVEPAAPSRVSRSVPRPGSPRSTRRSPT
ncbi:hypothetical protein [Streptomyces sp. DSM 40907]|uniref:hypothetical protein n=1 Tax=Streptomyces kutzneri TaxID=3051179 RepID=UPI0028D7D8BB|nr:hypothetical protein [Streptomyces sp. DSM 40907]